MSEGLDEGDELGKFDKRFLVVVNLHKVPSKAGFKDYIQHSMVLKHIRLLARRNMICLDPMGDRNLGIC
jgi:hypothetical protein